MKRINYRSDPSEIIDAILETNRRLSMKIDELEEVIRERTNAEERHEGTFYKKVIQLVDEDGLKITHAKAKALTFDNIRELKKEFEVKKGIEEVYKKKIRSLETHIDSLRSVLSFQKTSV